MDTKAALITAVIRTLTQVYPENDPRARARRFYPLFAKIGYLLTGISVIGGAIFLLTYPFPMREAACIFYGMTAFPAMGVGGYLVSSTLYRATVAFLRLKDKLMGPPKTDT